MTQVNPYQAPQASLDIIEDGEQILATPGSRLKAALWDGLYFGGVPAILGAVIALFARKSPVVAGVLGLVAVVYMLAVLFFTVRSVYRNGQTLGKRKMGIKVVRTDGSRVSMARMFFYRNVALGVIVNLLNLVTAGLASILSLADSLFIFRQSRQCLHDQIADTKVIKV